jgi:hypothetical protein
VAACAYAFSGFLVGHLQHLNILVGAAWLPWLLWCVERFFETRRARYLAFGSLAFGLQIAGGHTQIVLYSAAAWSIYALVRLARTWRVQGRHALRDALGLALMAFGGLGVAGAFVVPFAELLNFTARSEHISYDFATTFSLEPVRLLALLDPYFFGGNPGSVEHGAGSLIEMSAYLGILPLALAFYALDRHEWRVYFLTALGAVGLLLALGKYTPLYLIVYRLPLFGAVRAPARFLELFVFAMALLAGFGVDQLRRNCEQKFRTRVTRTDSGLAITGASESSKIPKVRILVVGSLAIAAIAVIGLWSAPRAGIHLSETLRLAAENPALVMTALFLAAGTVVLMMWERGWFSERVRLALTLGVVIVDLLFFGVNFRSNQVTAPTIYEEPTKNATFLMQAPDASTYYWAQNETKLASYLQKGALDDYVRLSGAGLRQSLPMRFGVRSMQGYGTEPPVYTDLVQVVEARDTLDRPAAALLALFGDSFVLSGQGLATDVLERIQRTGQVNLYRNKQGAFVGRTYVAWDARYFESGAAVVRALSQGVSNAGLVRLEGTTGVPAKVNDAQGSAIVEKAEPEDVVIGVETTQPGWLVLNDTYYPGWRATVDGQPTEILRANALVRAVGIEAGTHHVEFVYDPFSVKIGLVLSGVTLLLLGAVIVWDWRRARSATARK